MKAATYLLLLFAACLSFVRTQDTQANDSVSNRIIISRPDQTTTFSGDFSNGTSDASTLASLNRTFAGQDVPLEIFNVGANSQFKTLADLCAYLKEQNQDVSSCEPDVKYNVDSFRRLKDASTSPNDPLLSSQWDVPDINVKQAWAAGFTGNSQVKVCMVDTGVDYTHPDILANLWTNPDESANGKDNDGNGIIGDIHGVDFSNGGKTGDPMDQNGHGTFVAGVVGAVGNNAIGIAGISQSVSIIACKFMDATGNGWVSDAIRCFQYCMSKGAHIISNSWGGVDYSTSLNTTIQAASNTGVLMVCSAGNEGINTDTTNHYPSSFASDIVLAVGATDKTDAFWARSNYGKSTVHVAAPGVSVLGLGLGGTYITLTGTSMSTPHVAGTAALMLQRYINNGFQIDANSTVKGRGQSLKTLIMQTADSIKGVTGTKITTGLVNTMNAINAVPLTGSKAGQAVAQGEGFGPTAYLNGNDATGVAVAENRSALAPSTLLAPGPSQSNSLVQTAPYAVTPAAAAAASLVQQTIIAASQQQTAQIQNITGSAAATAPEAANTTTFPSTARFNAAPAAAPGASSSPSPVPQNTPTAASTAEGAFGRRH